MKQSAFNLGLVCGLYPQMPSHDDGVRYPTDIPLGSRNCGDLPWFFGPVLTGDGFCWVAISPFTKR
jgi:hypothetical protein